VTLRDRLKRLEQDAREEMVAISQPDGSVRRFPESELAPAFLDAFDRSVGRSDPDAPEHPLCAAARSSSDPAWRDSFYVSVWLHPVGDLSE
jgi:hypothetical protein